MTIKESSATSRRKGGGSSGDAAGQDNNSNQRFIESELPSSSLSSASTVSTKKVPNLNLKRRAAFLVGYLFLNGCFPTLLPDLFTGLEPLCLFLCLVFCIAIAYSIASFFAVVSIYCWVTTTELDPKLRDVLQQYRENGIEWFGHLDESPHNGKWRFRIRYTPTRTITTSQEQGGSSVVAKMDVVKSLHISNHADRNQLLTEQPITLLGLPKQDFSAIPKSEVDARYQELSTPNRDVWFKAASAYFIFMYILASVLFSYMMVSDNAEVLNNRLLRPLVLINFLVLIPLTRGYLVYWQQPQMLEAMLNSGETVPKSFDGPNGDVRKGRVHTEEKSLVSSKNVAQLSFV